MIIGLALALNALTIVILVAATLRSSDSRVWLAGITTVAAISAAFWEWVSSEQTVAAVILAIGCRRDDVRDTQMQLALLVSQGIPKRTLELATIA
jgi:hypothetical protein